MKEHCDVCNGVIQDNKCRCGEWFEKEKVPKPVNDFEKAILEFNKLNQPIISGDHHSGSCIIMFKGNYEDSQLARKLIEKNILNNV